MKRINKSAKRIAELEQAIRDAQGWLKVGEGVSLTYYYEHGYKEEHSLHVINQIIGIAAKRPDNDQTDSTL